MSDDLISRQAAKIALIEKGQHSRRYKWGEIWELNGLEIREVLDNLPSVQPKEKTGKWIKDEDGKVTCNNCYEYSIATDNIVGATDLLEVITVTMKYCPNCGAKMGV